MRFFLFPSIRSLPSPKANNGSLCLPVTFHRSFFFLLRSIIDAIFTVFIKNRISLHDVQEGRGDGSRDPFVEGFVTGQAIFTIFQKLMGFFISSEKVSLPCASSKELSHL